MAEDDSSRGLACGGRDLQSIIRQERETLFVVGWLEWNATWTGGVLMSATRAGREARPRARPSGKLAGLKLQYKYTHTTRAPIRPALTLTFYSACMPTYLDAVRHCSMRSLSEGGLSAIFNPTFPVLRERLWAAFSRFRESHPMPVGDWGHGRRAGKGLVRKPETRRVCPLPLSLRRRNKTGVGSKTTKL